MKTLARSLWLAAAVLSTGSAAMAADRFAPCAACHSLKPGENGIGPSLAGVVGRKAGTAPGFRYSAALRSSHVVWTPDALDRFLTDPQAFAPGNRMPFSGLSDAKERAAIIEQLSR